MARRLLFVPLPKSRLWNSLFLLILIFYLWGCATIYNPATGEKEIYFIDTKSEINIGRNISRSILRENKTIDDPQKIAYLERVGRKVTAVSDRKDIEYHFFILDAKGINAFALPGGYIFVNKDSLDKLTEEELAFVLAHEVGHIAARHSIKRLQASLGLELIMSIAFKNVNNDTILRATDIVYNIISLGYSRKDELLADSLAVKYTHRAGYSPQGGISLMKKLSAETGDDYTIIFLRSHPPVKDRIKNIEEKIRELKKG